MIKGAEIGSDHYLLFFMLIRKLKGKGKKFSKTLGKGGESQSKKK